MAEPFKNNFNVDMLRPLATHLARHVSGFETDAFVADASRDFSDLELKARSNAIRDTLIRYLPDDPIQALDVLCACLHPDPNDALTSGVSDERGVRGWIVMPMSDVVPEIAMEHFDEGMAALRTLTCGFTSEFAVRPFLAADPARGLEHASRWAHDPEMHVRRLASEGTRPRLPWGMRLDGFVADPATLLPLLTALRDDPEDYVRRSVANNLNDIAKDHPNLVASVAADWLEGASNDRQRLVKHACRSLIKAGHDATLAALGYGPPQLDVLSFASDAQNVTLDGKIALSAVLRSTSGGSQPLIVDYVIHHVKASGATSAKVFKWAIKEIAGGAELDLKKSHHFKPITTRVYYGGTHRISLQVNGHVLAETSVELTVPTP